MENNEDIREMKQEVLGGVQSVMNEVTEVFNFPKILFIKICNFASSSKLLGESCICWMVLQTYMCITFSG